MTYELTTIDTPLGVARALVRDGKLNAFALAAWTPRPSSPFARLHELGARAALDPAGVTTALGAYFRGEVDAIESIDVDPDGTEFQRRVWAALRTIPAGETRSYGELARALGMPSASRAVGAANGANPNWIVVPCHRVIGASGKLTGYAGGLDVKRWLLDHERAHTGLFATRGGSPSNSRGSISVKSPMSARSAAGCAGVSA